MEIDWPSLPAPDLQRAIIDALPPSSSVDVRAEFSGEFRSHRDYT